MNTFSNTFKKITFALFVILSFNTFNLQAQVKFGASLGGNFYNSFNNGLYKEYTHVTEYGYTSGQGNLYLDGRSHNLFDGGKVGYNAGLFVAMPLSERFEVESGIFYEKVSGNWSGRTIGKSTYGGNYFSSDIKLSYRYNYLTVPLLFSYKTQSIKGLRYILGAQFSLAMGGNASLLYTYRNLSFSVFGPYNEDVDEKVSIGSVDQRTLNTKSGDPNYMYNYRYNVSICAGLGYDINDRFALKCLYTYGLINTTVKIDPQYESLFSLDNKSYLHGLNLTLYVTLFQGQKKAL